MKILIATGLFPPEIGGPATYSKLLAEELPKREIEVKILPFSIVRSLPKILRHLVYGWKVFKESVDVDVIYAQDPVSVGLPVMLASRARGRRYFLKIVGDYAWEQGSQRFGVKDLLDDFSLKNNYAWPVKVLKQIQKTVANRAAKIIVPSFYLKKIVSNWGVAPAKVQVIYNSFDAPAELPTKERLREELKISESTIISVGRLVPWKGFDLLLELLPELEKEISGLKLLIVGDGPERRSLEKKIATLGLSGRVVLTGRLDHNLLLRYLKASDVFALNTSYEGFSHQLLEVMWTGTPIVTTSVGGNMELIKNEETGLLVPYNNKESFRHALSRLFQEKDLASKLSQAATEEVLNFTKERMVSELIQALNL